MIRRLTPLFDPRPGSSRRRPVVTPTASPTSAPLSVGGIPPVTDLAATPGIDSSDPAPHDRIASGA